MANPFLKWAGGKRKLTAQILDILPRLGPEGTYFEPFVGGGAVFFALQAAGRLTEGGAVLSDTNAELINCYQWVRRDPEAVIEVLKCWQAEHSSAFYSELRAMRYDDRVMAAARMIYLNKTCYNGLYRVNLKGGFNAPWGKHAKFTADVEGIRAASAALQCAGLYANPFDLSVSDAQPGDVVYFDPPYVPVKKGSFVGYGSDRFRRADHVDLRDLMLDLDRRGVPALLSNSDCEYTRALYDRAGLHFTRVEMSRSVNSKGTGRGKVGELLVANAALLREKRLQASAQLAVL